MTLHKRAIVTGALGQDGYYLSRSLKRNGVSSVIGIARPSARPGNDIDKSRLRNFDQVLDVDLRDTETLRRVVCEIQPHFILNFGAIAGSLTQQGSAEDLIDTNVRPVAAMLEAIKVSGAPTVFVQASSSEVFAGGFVSPQGLHTPRVSRTIYGMTKIAADNLIQVYRNHFGLKCYSVILFSHESPLRAATYFSKRLVADALDVVEGKRRTITVHSPDAIRDWGYAGEYCETVIRGMLAGGCGDVVIGTGTGSTVRSFAQIVCAELGLDYASCVIEKPLQAGRAAEGIEVVASPNSYRSCFPNGAKYNINRLVKLLLRCERKRRRRSNAAN